MGTLLRCGWWSLTVVLPSDANDWLKRKWLPELADAYTYDVGVDTVERDVVETASELRELAGADPEAAAAFNNPVDACGAVVVCNGSVVRTGCSCVRGEASGPPILNEEDEGVGEGSGELDDEDALPGPSPAFAGDGGGKSIIGRSTLSAKDRIQTRPARRVEDLSNE